MATQTNEEISRIKARIKCLREELIPHAYARSVSSSAVATALSADEAELERFVGEYKGVKELEQELYNLTVKVGKLIEKRARSKGYCPPPRYSTSKEV